MTGSSSWNGGLPDEDFQQFFDLSSIGNHAAGDMHYGFDELLRQNASAQDMDTPMTGTASTNTHAVAGSAAALMPPVSSSSAASLAELDAKIEDLRRMRREAQLRQIEEQNANFFASPHLNQNNFIMPPTPQSLELQSGTQLYASNDQHMQQQQQQQQHAQLSMRHHQQQQRHHQFFERYQQANDQQDLLFTPLVSPAVTPLDTQFDVQFNSAFFTPLTSPALQVQVESASMFDSSTTSNNELDLNMFYLPDPAASPNVAATDMNKKTRKANAGARTRKPSVRPSPITKPQRKKSTTTPIISAKALGELAETLEKEGLNEALPSPVPGPQPQQQQQQQQQQLLVSASTAESENGSVSPVNLTAMPPPPRPATSALSSPYLHAVASDAKPSSASASGILPGGAPIVATPASLMRLSSSRQKRHKPSPALSASSRPSPSVGPAAVANEHIEALELPESLSIDFLGSDVAALEPAQNSPNGLGEQTPSRPLASSSVLAPPPPPPPPLFTHARRGTVTSAPSVPSTTTTPTPSAEPLALAAQRRGAPAGPATAGPAAQQQQQANRRTPQLLPRVEKRAGAGAAPVQISPALRPRISPNLKPLLPGQPLSAAEDQASRLLATKSNYQNILEGNMVPGVSYPSELSTSLTSKRTSHKLAEQGRRNRINAALQELAAMLPPVAKDNKGDSKGAKTGGSDNSNDEDAEAGPDAKKGGSGSGSGSGKGNGEGPNSKADTVELAIEYIRQLKKEVAEATGRAEEAESQLRAARAAADGGGESS